MVAVQLILALVFGGITAMIATNKGRSGIGWFFIGFLTGLIGLIIILVLEDRNQKRNRRQRVDNKQRRLEEKLRQEKMKNESFQEYTKKRLDKHDRELGIDTSGAGENILEDGIENDVERLKTGKTEQEKAESNKREWYYELRDHVHGPVTRDQILTLLADDELTPETPVRNENMDDWKPISKIPGLFK